MPYTQSKLILIYEIDNLQWKWKYKNVYNQKKKLSF